MARFVLLPDEWTDEECRKVVDVWQKNLNKEKLYIVVSNFEADTISEVTPLPQQDEQLAEEQLRDEQVDHPSHYGGADSPFETIKVIEAWNLDFCLGNTIKYISRAGRKEGADLLTDLKKAAWYLNRKIEQVEKDANV